MKLTKNKLKQIIKEEFSAAMEEENGPEGGPTTLILASEYLKQPPKAYQQIII
mgnify:CR=1 FL=1